MPKQNVFWAFEFYKRRVWKRPRKTIKSQAKQLWISRKNFENSPNLIGLASSKIYMSTRRQETQSLSLEEWYNLAANKNFKEPRKTLQKLQQDLVNWTQENQPRNGKKSKCKARHKGRKE